jgi:UDP-glucose 4-epimerase
MGKILVTGGCGYIGSHCIVDLLENGFEVISVDSHIRSGVEMLAGVFAVTGKKISNFKIDLCDSASTLSFFSEHADIDAVIHFAALKSVPESVQKPLLYYQNNINSLANVLQNMQNFGIKNLIFSSSCSVYGNTKELPVHEQTICQKAESPYAQTKQICEQMIADCCASNVDLNAVLLRYFNPAGAHKSGKMGEIPRANAYNMVPILTEIAAGLRANFTVFGNDYPTRDGSCVRDYIYIMDLADAHTRCLNFLLKNQQTQNLEVFNVGIGLGVTVLEAIQAFEKVIKKPFPYQIGARRAGDIAAIYANYDKAAQLLGWKPQFGIDTIMETAWFWQQKMLENS